MNKEAFIKNQNQSTQTYTESPYEKFKTYDRYVFVKHIMQESLDQAETFLDIGCAKAEFIWSIKEEFPQIKYTGLEYSEALINLAKKESTLKDVTLIQGDAQDFELHQEFDVVLMSGVHSIFDDWHKPIAQMLKHTKSGGKGYIFGMFNPHDVDVLVRYKNNAVQSESWESGLNNFSLMHVVSYLKQNTEKCDVHKFEISADLTIGDNPINSYTLKTDQGKIIANGTGLITDFYLLEYQL